MYFKGITIGFVLSVILFVSTGHSVVMRHDLYDPSATDPSKEVRYQQTANQSRFASVGALVIGLTAERLNNGAIPRVCSAVLINPYTVITARHCFLDSKTGTETTKKQLENLSVVFGPDDLTPSARLRIIDWKFPSGYDDVSYANDIILLQVYDAATNSGSTIEPAQLYTTGNELGGFGFPVVVGYGIEGFGANTPSGTGIVGFQSGDGLKRAYVVPKSSGILPPELRISPDGKTIITQFLSPNALLSRGFSLNLLSGAASVGDSGGGFFVPDPSNPTVWALAGITSWETNSFNGVYGQQNGFVRISAIANWINSNMFGAPTEFYSDQSVANSPSQLSVGLTSSSAILDVPVSYDCGSTSATANISLSSSSPNVVVNITYGGQLIGSLTSLPTSYVTKQFSYSTSSFAACSLSSASGYVGSSRLLTNLTVEIIGVAGDTVNIDNISIPGMDVDNFSDGLFGWDVEGSPSLVVMPDGQLPSQIILPNVVGQSQQSAESSITGIGLVVGVVTTQPSLTVPAGEVISQIPDAATEVNSGTAVDLVVSSGDALIAIPSVVGFSQPAAESAIQSASLMVGTISTQTSMSVPEGDVISQNPVANTDVAFGSEVNLVVSSGEALMMIPNTVGQTQAVAESEIVGVGLVLGTVITQSSSTVPAGAVISQNPIANTDVSPGSAVNLVVSSGESLTPIPDVAGLSQSIAESSIVDADLLVGTVTTQSSSTVPSGNVISQDPAASTEVASGSTVNLIVSSGEALISIPDVVGQTQQAAESTILSSGLIVGMVDTQSSATVPVGEVISQDPSAESNVSSGSAVSLVVSSGNVSTADSDGDGVNDSNDICPVTVLPENKPQRLKKNRYYADQLGNFVDKNGILAGYSVISTRGCSGIQIIDALGLGKGHRKFGITRGVLGDWVASLK